MSKSRKGARERVLDAAEELARSVGPGNLSLDSVAHRAGVSKGGLLYHFPSKSRLLEALVERFLGGLDEALEAREHDSAGQQDSVLRAYLDFFMEEHERHKPPPSGLMAALAEDPGFLNPVRRYERKFLDRMKANATDSTRAMVIFLALNGVRSMQLLNLEILTEDEFEAVTAWMRAATAEPGAPS